jgi:hypothetical protein
MIFIPDIGPCPAVFPIPVPTVFGMIDVVVEVLWNINGDVDVGFDKLGIDIGSKLPDCNIECLTYLSNFFLLNLY